MMMALVAFRSSLNLTNITSTTMLLAKLMTPGEEKPKLEMFMFSDRSGPNHWVSHQAKDLDYFAN